MRTLAVDDDASIRALLPIILAEAGVADVTPVGSGAEALDAIAGATQPYECFLLDIQMPAMTGIELCEAIRAIPAHRKTPVLMLTAMRERGFIDDAFAAGASDYVTKPFDLDEVRDRIGRVKEQVETRRRQRGAWGGSGGFAAERGTPGFESATDLGAVKGLMSTHVFENYLRQIAKSGVLATNLFAIHVMGARDLWDYRSPGDFRHCLSRVAQAASAAPASGHMLFCYLGAGNFICSTSLLAAGSTAQLEAEMQDDLDDNQIVLSGDFWPDLEVATGAPVPPMLARPMQLDAIAAQAVKLAEQRAQGKARRRAGPTVSRAL